MSFSENRTKLPLWIFSKSLRDVFKKDHLGQEIAEIAMPAALGLLADPIASLIDTAFVGHLGAMELAAVGVAIAVFNQASRIAIFPIVSITTSFVAEEDSIVRLNNENGKPENSCCGDLELEEFLPQRESEGKSLSAGKLCSQKRNISSASSALSISAVLGLIQALSLICFAKPILNYMGVDSASPMLKPAEQYLTLRSLGAPAVVLSLTMQGVFRGLKDTRTPLYATGGVKVSC